MRSTLIAALAVAGLSACHPAEPEEGAPLVAEAAATAGEAPRSAAESVPPAEEEEAPAEPAADATGEPTPVEPAQPEPAQPEPVQPESAQPEPVQPEPVPTPQPSSGTSPGSGFALSLTSSTCAPLTHFESQAPAACADKGAQLAEVALQPAQGCVAGQAQSALVRCGAPLARVADGARWSKASHLITDWPASEWVCRTIPDWMQRFPTRDVSACGPYHEVRYVLPVGSSECGPVIGDGPFRSTDVWSGITVQCGVPVDRSAEGSAFHVRGIGTAGVCSSHAALQQAAASACAEDGAALTQVVPIADAACEDGQAAFAWAGCSSEASEEPGIVHLRVGEDGVCRTRTTLKGMASEQCRTQGGSLTRTELAPVASCGDVSGHFVWATCSFEDAAAAP